MLRLLASIQNRTRDEGKLCFLIKAGLVVHRRSSVNSYIGGGAGFWEMYYITSLKE